MVGSEYEEDSEKEMIDEERGDSGLSRGSSKTKESVSLEYDDDLDDEFVDDEEEEYDEGAEDGSDDADDDAEDDDYAKKRRDFVPKSKMERNAVRKGQRDDFNKKSKGYKRDYRTEWKVPRIPTDAWVSKKEIYEGTYVESDSSTKRYEPDGYERRPRYGDDDNSGFRRDYGDRPRREFGDRPKRDFGDKPRRDFGDRPKRDFGDRPKRDFGDRPRRDYGDRPRRDFGDRPKRDFGDCPRRDFGDRPRRDFGDRPRRDYGDRPKRDYKGRSSSDSGSKFDS